jgi:hypothetical protein
MTGSTLGLVITSIVTVIVLVPWIALVFYAGTPSRMAASYPIPDTTGMARRLA